MEHFFVAGGGTNDWTKVVNFIKRAMNIDYATNCWEYLEESRITWGEIAARINCQARRERLLLTPL